MNNASLYDHRLLPNGAHARFHRKVAALIPIISDQAQEYRQAADREAEAMQVFALCPTIEKVADYHVDIERNLIEFLELVQTLKKHFDKNKRHHANIVDSEIKRWKIDNYCPNFKTQIDDLNRLLNALRKPEQQEAMQKLHIIDWFQKLDRDNRELDSLLTEETKNSETFFDSIERISSARGRADSMYLKIMINHLEKRNVINENDNFVKQILYLIEN